MDCTIGSWSEWDGEGIAYDWPDNYSTLETKRSRKCHSCGAKINVGDVCGPIRRFRCPNSSIEENIYGEEVPLATFYFCEKCTDILFNLEDLGYSVGVISMYEALEEYKDYQKVQREEK